MSSDSEVEEEDSAQPFEDSLKEELSTEEYPALLQNYKRQHLEEEDDAPFLAPEGYRASRNLPLETKYAKRLNRWKSHLNPKQSITKINNICKFLEEHALLVLTQSFSEADKEFKSMMKQLSSNTTSFHHGTGDIEEEEQRSNALKLALCEKCEKLLRGILVYGTKRVRRGALDLADGLYRHLEDM
jgi:hypothetical protein